MEKNRIFLLGYMGSGKTTIGRLLAEKLQFRFFDLDQYIEEKMQMSVSEIFTSFGEPRFRETEHKSLQKLAQMENAVISTGGGAPCFQNNMDIILRAGKSFYLYWKTEDLALRLVIDGLHKRPLLHNKTPQELLVFIETSLAEREKFYLRANHIIKGNGEVEMVNEIINLLHSK